MLRLNFVIDSFLSVFLSPAISRKWLSVLIEDFLRASKCVASVPLSPSLVHFIFVLFDSNGDGELNYSEFIDYMKEARARGLTRSRNLGAAKGFKALVRCIKIQIADEAA